MVSQSSFWGWGTACPSNETAATYERRSKTSRGSPAHRRPLGLGAEIAVPCPAEGRKRELMQKFISAETGQGQTSRNLVTQKCQPVARFEIRRSLRSVLVRWHTDAGGSAGGKAHRQWTISVSRADVVLLSFFAYHLDVDLAPSTVRILPRIVA